MKKAKRKPSTPWQRRDEGGLTPMQRRFVDCYAGNAKAAAIEAGYSQSGASLQGIRLLSNDRVIAAINERDSKRKSALIASREERQELLTSFLRDPETRKGDRLKAIELLGKMSGDFIERRIVEDRREKRRTFWEVAIELAAERSGQGVGGEPAQVCTGGVRLAIGTEADEAADPDPGGG